MTVERVEFSDKLKFLFEPARYKVLWGGRGGIKSWGIARALLVQGSAKPLRIPCARETMQSIKDSVHQLLEDQVKLLKLEGHYKVLKSSITGKNGTEFSFHGLRDLSVHNIKSLEGADILWVEEAQAVRSQSWETVAPTIRKPGSEIWVSFNPSLETDATYQRFIVHPPPRSVVVKTSWRDNLWLSDELRLEKDALLARDPDEYQHVWEGLCKQTVTGAIYKQELQAAEKDNRITRVPYDAARPVDTFWDLGFADSTSIWLAQTVGFEIRLIDFISGSQQSLQYYLNQLQSRGYVYGSDYLPHDARAHQLGSGKSIEEMMRAAGRRVKVVPRLSIVDGIAAVRAIFNRCWFDRDKCSDGVQALRHYRYEPDEAAGTLSRQPLHDWACFHPETKVVTRHGMYRIIDLGEKHKEVLTPCGWKPFQGPRLTRRNARLVEVRFTDGYTVKCTPEHLFCAENEWRCAESLTPGMRIRSCLTHSRSISMEASIAFGRENDTSRGAAKDYTGRLGAWLSGVFRRVTRSITGIPILQTTRFPIWSASPTSSTPATHGRSESPRVYFRRPLGKLPQPGINPKQEDSGTADRPAGRKAGRNGNARSGLAPSAVWKSMRWFAHRATNKSSAQRPASHVTIESVRPLQERADVWCIYVEDGHWFSLSNGAVVHNSHPADAFRSLAVAAKEPERQKEIKKRQRPQLSTWS